MVGPGKGFGDLVKEVISPGVCSGCAACVLVCPYNLLEYEGEKPQRKVSFSLPPDRCVIDERWGCGVCALVCPRLNPQTDRIEREALGRSRTSGEEFGVFHRIVAARSTDQRVLRVCQDGGVVTTLLTWLIDLRVVDGAVVSSPSGSRACYPVPRVVTTYDELLESAGSWYTYSPNLLGLKEARERGLEKVAFVGVPCQIEAIRMMDMNPEELPYLTYGGGDRHLRRVIGSLRDYGQLVALTVGLFCSQCFTYDGLMAEKLKVELGLRLEDITKINIKGKVLVHLNSGEVVEVPLEEVRPYTRPECQYCGDFSAELADISVGGVGAEGWTITILRTRRGELLFDQMVEEGLLVTRPIEEFQKSLKLIPRLSRGQRLRAIKAYKGVDQRRGDGG